MMRRIIYLLFILALPIIAFGQSNQIIKNVKVTKKSRLIQDVVIGDTDFEGSAILTITSSSQGMLAPRMNTAARDGIGSPADGLLIYNDQTNQYEFFESTWKAVGGDGNGIYGGDGSLSSSPTTVTMGGNELNFFGDQTGFRGINAAFGTRVALFEDNVGTNLVEINNNGSVGVGTAGFASTRIAARSADNTTASFSFIGQNLAGDINFAVAGNGNIGFGTLGFLVNSKVAFSEMDNMVFDNTFATTPVSDLRWIYDNDIVMVMQYTDNDERMDLFVGGTAAAADIVMTVKDRNMGINTQTFGANAERIFAMGTAIAPTTSPANIFQMYAADVVAGNMSPHFRTEVGDIIKLFSDGSYVDPTGTTDKGTFATSTVTTEDLAEFVKAMYETLKANGLIKN